MSIKTISERVDAAYKASSEDFGTLEELLVKNLERADQRSTASIVLFASITAIWILLKISGVQKVSIFGMELQNIPLILATLPTLAAYAYYQFSCVEGLAALIDQTLMESHRRRFGKFYDSDLTQLLSRTTPHHIEASLKNMEPATSKFRTLADAWGIALALILIGIPVAIMAWMLWSTIATTSHWVLRLGSSIAVVLLTGRGLLLFIQWLRMI